MSKLHIADIDFPAFYGEVFPDTQAARDFYSRVDALPPQKNAAKIILHQAARMVWLADQIDEVACGRPAFQVLFYLIAAELVAKITFDFQGEGESRKHVRKFFAEICDDETRDRLAMAFPLLAGGHLTCEGAVNLLYDVRCDVVHEGMYYGFHLQEEQDSVPQVVHVGNVRCATNLALQELRLIVLKGAVSASRKLLQVAEQSATAASNRP